MGQRAARLRARVEVEEMVKALGEIGILLSLCAVAVGLTFWLHPRAPSLRSVAEDPSLPFQVTVQEVRERFGPDVTWIDARPREDYEAGHVSGALLLNAEEWADLMWDLSDRLDELSKTTVVVYCDGTTCGRSAEVAERLRGEVGLEQVYVLKGDWREFGQSAP